MALAFAGRRATTADHGTCGGIGPHLRVPGPVYGKLIRGSVEPTIGGAPVRFARMETDVERVLAVQRSETNE
jgi:hypothetical protein